MVVQGIGKAVAFAGYEDSVDVELVDSSKVGMDERPPDRGLVALLEAGSAKVDSAEMKSVLEGLR